MPGHQHIFNKYASAHFIEGGCFKGESIEMMRQVPGSTSIKSIEIHEPYYLDCVQKFKNDYRVQLYHGRTEELLEVAIAQTQNLIQNLESEHQLMNFYRRITFWLDAHGSGPGTPSSENICPLLIELEIIKKSGRKNDIILIDDIRCCNTELFEDSFNGRITKEMLESKVREINPNYNIMYEDSWERSDIMCCYIK